MRRIKILFIGFLAIAATGFLNGCSKQTDDKFLVESSFNNSSLIQVYVATVNASRNHFYIDKNQLSGSVMSSGSIFPSSAYASAVSPGLRAFLVRDTFSTTTQVPLSFAQNLQADKNYTVFLYDTITTPKQKTVITDIIVPADSSARIRIANFIYNPTAVPNIDIYSFHKAANIFTNVAVTDVTNYISYPSKLAAPLFPDTLYIRETGTLTNILKVPITLTEKRSYTLVYRGSHRGTRVGSLIVNR